MNQLYPLPRDAAREAAQARFARGVVDVLDHGVNTLQTDVTTRLRFARSRALDRARSARAERQTRRLGVTGQGAVILGGSERWLKLAAFAPLVALVGGLLLIQVAQNRAQVAVAAEVDAALLADDLPPKAYTDPGFGEFLKQPPRQ